MNWFGSQIEGTWRYRIRNGPEWAGRQVYIEGTRKGLGTASRGQEGSHGLGMCGVLWKGQMRREMAV